MIRGSRSLWAAALGGLVLMAGARPALAETLAGLTTAKLKIGSTNLGRIDALIVFDSEYPEIPYSLRFVSGLVSGQSLVGIDVRPATGELYGIGVAGCQIQLYRVDPATGAATAVGTGFGDLLNPEGTAFGFDFNPTIDRIRMISTTGQNLVFNPDTGDVTPATSVFFVADDVNAGDVPKISSIAYDNSVAGATTTVLRGIDLKNDALVRIASSAGELRTIGSLGFKVRSAPAFEVSGATGVAHAVLRPKESRSAGLYTLDLATGLATPTGLPLFGLFPITALTALPAE